MSGQPVLLDGSSSPETQSCIFYKLMVGSILHDSKLRIPEKFVKRYRDELSSTAKLTASDGRVWPVELLKADNKLWFDNGWQEFVEHYSIRVGYFLIFRYERSSDFKVYVFDLENSEIKYPCNSISSSQELGDDKQSPAPHQKGCDLNKISGSFPPCPNPIPSENKSLDDSRNSTYTADVDCLNVRRKALDFQGTFQSTRDVGIQCNWNELLCTIDAFRTRLPDSAEQRTKKQKQTNELCKNYEPVSLGIDKVARVKSTRVSVARRWIAVTEEEKARAVHAAELFNSDNPFCRIVLRPSYLTKRSVLHMPSSFANKYLTRDTEFLTLEVSGGKQWRVGCLYEVGKTKLSRGWAEFAWANNLEEGDVCIFELMNLEKMILKVTIFHVLDDNKGQQNKPSV
ncbi:B3 domain-containing transcription factor VRN1-like [Tripterygium wilfordii]|uniref:B3 domain-containing transcription factor VRN1-like n=1 Tax=Tripterygium wilfordii TaxID=458696 RepID=A0A7J7BZF1_TRIWF|nr:B3 domain-containing transcription factor VRN1-like [Tripterygium wilfordii]KAF5727232.1 B3 domain-containing transcription factor VRN1-like [Tripterygium wilfordii]